MDRDIKELQNLKGKDLEEYGAKIFQNLGLTCCYGLNQVRLNDITTGYSDSEHIEFDYIIPHNNVCLIGEITAREGKKEVKNRYNTFVKHINIIKQLDLTEDLWIKIGIRKENIKLFREIEEIEAFFITTKEEKYSFSLSKIQNVVVFHKSDFLRIIEYSKAIGKWSKNYFLRNFNIEHSTNTAINVYQKSNSLIINKNKKVAAKCSVLADLYTFTISPYQLLNIAHVHRKDELPSLQINNHNYQRLLNSEKLQKIRQDVLVDSDFMFATDILVVLSEECGYCKDNMNEGYLRIPNKYGTISIVDGQHRLFSYADFKVESIMQSKCQIRVTAIGFDTSDEQLISQLSARVFIDINANQTKVDISHIDQIAYDLGSEDPKVIATKIIIGINARSAYSSFFDVNSDKISKGLIEAGVIIDVIKKITNINKIKKLENSRSGKTKLKKDGYEYLFDCQISELCDKDVLVEKGIVLIERYFNEIFSTFKYDKPDPNNISKSSFQYSKFWAGLANLLCIFIEEGLNRVQIKEQLEAIKVNLMKLQEIKNYNRPLFESQNINIPDAKYSATEISKFLNENRYKAYSIQNIK